MNRESFLVLSVDGYMGNEECLSLEAELERLLEQGQRKAIVDFAGLSFITSVSLVRLSKKIRFFRQRGGHLLLANLPSSAIALMKLANLEKILKPAENLATAIETLAGHDAI